MFSLHQTLEADTVELARWPLCRVLLMNESRYPWLILVPERPGLKDLHDMSPEDLTLVMAEIIKASEALEKVYKPHKTNVAALGNVVEQLHIHVIARYMDDPAWPAPVWGKFPPTPYSDGMLSEAVSNLTCAWA